MSAGRPLFKTGNTVVYGDSAKPGGKLGVLAETPYVLEGKKKNLLGCLRGLLPVPKRSISHVIDGCFPFQHQAIECPGIALSVQLHPEVFLDLVRRNRRSPRLSQYRTCALTHRIMQSAFLFTHLSSTFDIWSSGKDELCLPAVSQSKSLVCFA